MLYRLKNLIEHANSCEACINGKWVPARPLNMPWTWRIPHAWGVLTGKYDAIEWPEGQ